MVGKVVTALRIEVNYGGKSGDSIASRSCNQLFSHKNGQISENIIDNNLSHTLFIYV